MKYACAQVAPQYTVAHSSRHVATMVTPRRNNTTCNLSNSGCFRDFSAIDAIATVCVVTTQFRLLTIRSFIDSWKVIHGRQIYPLLTTSWLLMFMRTCFNTDYISLTTQRHLKFQKEIKKENDTVNDSPANLTI